MRITRLGQLDQEKPAVLVSDTEAVFVDDLISDFNRVELENGSIAMRMGEAGMNKALNLYDEQKIINFQIERIEKLLESDKRQ